MKRKEPKQPIALSSIIQYYLQENTLKRNKKEIILQLKDIITIIQFLHDRIPSSMKAIKEVVRMQQGNIKDFSQSLKNSTKILNDELSFNTTYNLQSAYNQMKHFSFNKQSDKDYVQKTLAQKQMKLYFLQSQNLPDDFIWHKPIRDPRNHSNTQKDYTWYSHFNPKSNMIQIITRKYMIGVSFIVINKIYVWTIAQIKCRLSQQIALWLMQYFQTRIKPVIKSKYGNNQQQNMLSCIDKFAYFLQLLEFQQSISQLCQCQKYAKEMHYRYKQKTYIFIFNRPQDFTDSLITIYQQSNPQYILILQYLKKQIKGIFKIASLITFQTLDQLKFQNSKSLLMQFQKLIQYGKKYVKLTKKQFINVSNQLHYFFIRHSGMLWIYNSDQQVLKNKYYFTKQDGIFIGKQLNDKLSYVSLKNDGSISSRYISPIFLNNLFKNQRSLDAILSFVYLIQSILQTNFTKQSQLDYYIAVDDKKKAFLYFKKKTCVQQQLLKSIPQRTNLIEQDNQTNFIRCYIDINFSFTDICFYVMKQKDLKQSQKLQQWNAKFRQKSRQNLHSLLNVQQIIQTIQYIQQHLIIKYIYDKRFRGNIKSSIVMNL